MSDDTVSDDLHELIGILEKKTGDARFDPMEIRSRLDDMMAAAGSTTATQSTGRLTVSPSLTEDQSKRTSAGGSKMLVVRLKHVKRYRVRGKVYWYHRVTNERLPDDEFKRVQRVLHINATLDGQRSGAIPGSIGDLIGRYKASPEFKGLAAATRRSYMSQIKVLEDGFADECITEIDTAWLYTLRDYLSDTPRTANLMLSVLSILLNFAIARGLCQSNPVRNVKRLRKGKSYERWPEPALEKLRAGANARMVWAVELAIYTGQRQGDVLAMQWRHLKDGLIEVAQEKTKERLSIPIHQDLAAVLDAIPRVGTNIVHRENGQSYTADGFRSIFQRDMKRLGLIGLQFHGLRHTAASLLAEAGCSEREIMAITGHRTASMVSHYTRGADQERLAKAAIVKLKPRTKLSTPAD